MSILPEALPAPPQSYEPKRGRLQLVAIEQQQPHNRRIAEQLPALTGLRFFAALLVVFHHVTMSFRWGLVLPGTVGYNIGFGGHVGVNLFFILSGFILCHSYVERDGSLRTSRRQFYVARIARIYPVYLLGIVVAAVPYSWGHDAQATPAITLPAVLALVQAWIPYVGTAWNPPGWSLSVESLFYLLFPLLVPLIVRQSPRRLLGLALVAWVIALAPAIAYMLINPDHAANTALWEKGPWLWLVQYYPFVRLPEFVLGLTLGRLFALYPKRLSVLAPLGVISAIVALAFVPWPYALLHCGLLDPFFVLLIYGLACGEGMLARLLQTRPLVTLGEASYALYILHYPLWQWLDTLVPVPSIGEPLLFVYLTAYCSCAIALSLLVLRFIEQPARRAIRRAASA